MTCRLHRKSPTEYCIVKNSFSLAIGQTLPERIFWVSPLVQCRHVPLHSELILIFSGHENQFCLLLTAHDRNLTSDRDAAVMGLNQRIYKTKKPRQRTRRPKTGPWSECNSAILLNVTLDPHEENTSEGI